MWDRGWFIKWGHEPIYNHTNPIYNHANPTSGSPCSFYLWVDAQTDLPDANDSRCGGSVPSPRGGYTTPVLTCTNRETGLQWSRELIALLAHLGGLDIPVPIRSASQQLESCQQVTAPLVDLIISRSREYPRGVQQEQRQLKPTMRSVHREKIVKEA